MTRRTLGINIARHEQMRSQKGGILPMGTPWPIITLHPMLPDQKPFFSRLKGLVGRGR